MELRSNNINALQAIKLRVQELASKQGKVGWFESSKYEDETPVANVAAQNEFGNPSKHIPPRPTVRPAIIEHEKEWKEIAAQGAIRIIEGKASASDVMETITLAAEGEIAKNIRSITSPPLAPYTIEMRKKKGNTSIKPLVDTGLELATLTSVVEDAAS